MPKRQPTPDIAEIQRRFSLNRETGRITANFPSGRWGRLPAGRLVDTYINPKGYRLVMFEGRDYYAHYISWLIENGAPPLGEIDHRNRDKGDNRPKNLRDVTHTENQWNLPVSRRNKLGLKGIVSRGTKGYEVNIAAHGESHYIGIFKTICGAVKARKAAERIYHQF